MGVGHLPQGQGQCRVESCAPSRAAGARRGCRAWRAGSAHIPCCHCGLHFPGLGPGDTAPEVFAGCSRVVTLPLQGRKASPRLPHFHGNLGVPMPQLPVGDCSGRSATWKWPLALCWRLPKGIAGGRRIWAGPDLGLPLLSVTLLRGSQVILSLDLETTARE